MQTKWEPPVRTVVAAMTIALSVSVACAQSMSGTGGMGGGKGGRGRSLPSNPEQQKADQQKKKAADDAYKAWLAKIPDAGKNMIRGRMRANRFNERYSTDSH
jgi:hypothetical protein